MKTVNEIFDFLVRNAFYYRQSYSDKEIRKMIDLYLNGDDKISLEVSLGYIPGFHVELDKFLSFMNKEQYSYANMIKPLVDQKLISIVGDLCYQEGSSYNTRSYQKIFDSTIGLVADENKSYVRFWLGDFKN